MLNQYKIPKSAALAMYEAPSAYSKEKKSVTTTGTLTLLSNGNLDQTGKVPSCLILEKEITKLMGNQANVNAANAAKVAQAQQAAVDKYGSKQLTQGSINPILKSLESFKQIGSDIIYGAGIRANNAFNSAYDFTNWLTIGMLDGIVTSSADRASRAFDSPYDFVNWLTIGIPDMAKGALAPDDVLSKEHWLNSLGLATLTYSAMKPVLTGNNGVMTTADLQQNFYRYSDSIVRTIDDAAEGGTKTINPNEIRYSQSSVNGAGEIIDSMKAKGWTGDPIDVVKMPDGKLTTVDNTRVLAAKNAGIDVQATIHGASDPISSDIAVRFASKNGQVPQTWGEAIINRINNQNSVYKTTYPNGSYITGWDGN